jgi:hypothetical protein
MNYRGSIVEESLEDRSILNDLKMTLGPVQEEVTEKHQTPWVRQWTHRFVEIPLESAREFAERLSKALDSKHAWYADFKTDFDHYIIFREKVFHVTDRTSKEQYDQATQFGLSLGIPAYQLDFSPYIKQWAH